MDTAAKTAQETSSLSTKSHAWKFVWFVAHLAVVYLVVNWVTSWLAGWFQGFLLPALVWPKSESQFQFLFSHVFAFSFVPAFLISLANVRFKQNVVAYVWLVPTMILSYKLLTFTTPSVLQNHASSAFHQYFGGGFSIPEYRNWQEFWSITASSADMERGLAQMRFTAPFYAGLAYSIGGLIGARIDLRQKVATKVGEWEDAKFGPRQP
jgi:hypothetical protein